MDPAFSDRLANKSETFTKQQLIQGIVAFTFAILMCLIFLGLYCLLSGNRHQIMLHATDYCSKFRMTFQMKIKEEEIPLLNPRR